MMRSMSQRSRLSTKGDAGAAFVADLELRLRAGQSVAAIARAYGKETSTMAYHARATLRALREEGVTCGCGGLLQHVGSCDHNGRVAPEQIERRNQILGLLARGVPVEEIGRRLGRAPNVIDRYRRFLTPAQMEQRARGITERRRRNAIEAPVSAHRDPLYAQVARAVPASLPRHLRDDIISDMIVAVLEGREADAVCADARRFIGRGFRQWASKFGPASLDEARFDDSAETLVASIPDPAALAAFDQFDNLILGRIS